MAELFLTLGTNELPCTVAAYRLCKYFYKQEGRLPRIWAICSEETGKKESGPGSYAGRVLFALKKRLQDDPELPKKFWLEWKQIFVEPYDPIRIYDTVLAEAKRLNGVGHVHYTGGTKAMSVEAARAVEIARVNSDASSTYLDPESHCLRGRLDAGVPDEREEWKGKLTIEELAKLHGFHEIKTEQPKAEVVAAGKRMTELLALRNAPPRPEELRKEGWYIHWLDQVWKKGEWRDLRGGYPAETTPVPWYAFKSDADEWEKLTVDLKDAFGGDEVWRRTSTGWEIDRAPRNEQAIRRLYKFLDNQFLELYVFESLRTALAGTGPSYHSIIFKRIGAQLEIDVAGLLGYQLVAVSCTFSNARKTVKMKAFEALHRARQIGGDQARAMVICLMDDRDALGLEKELHDDVGSPDRPLQIWGRDQLRVLATEFRKYLTKRLGWSLPSADAETT